MPRQTTSRRIRMASAFLALLLPARLAAAQERMPGLDTRTELVRIGPGTSATLTLPPGAAPGRPLAVVVLLPDADGLGPRSALYGQRLLENGIALLEPDFLGGLAEDMPLPPAAARLALAVAAVDADPRLDPRRLAVVGLGEGGRAALLGQAAMAAGLPLALLYPGCDAALAAAAARAAGPVLLLHGDEDAANQPADCARLAAAFPQPEAVRHSVLAGASYGWDAYDLVRPGGLTRLQDPAGTARRTWSRPDMTTTMVAADRVLGFVLAAVGR
ncbi:dienelactone hydrolase family protein [Dankookia sp. P2]|uniref:dienelactone hydrolase family protein n=1 Tax=Dankookia sp. P2 TaxID=3423955 RepID=UPI003D67847B